MTAIANHLIQSTFFASLAGLLTLAFRKNRAQIRYALWLSASVKFLIPFSLLIAAGSHFGARTTVVIAAPALSSLNEQLAEPVTTSIPLAESANRLPAALAAVWIIGFALVVTNWCRRWRNLRAAIRGAGAFALPNIEALTSPAFPEPGVYGIFKPILLLPTGITDQLTPAQLKSILDHELCHIRRRDNLATAIHMAVEAIFWFHPLVWWLGARLMEERERACDEEVLRHGNKPQTYAESHPQNLRTLPGIPAALRLRNHRRQSQTTRRDNHGESHRTPAQPRQSNSAGSGSDGNSRCPHRNRRPQRPHTHRGIARAPRYPTRTCERTEIQICVHQTLPTILAAYRNRFHQFTARHLELQLRAPHYLHQDRLRRNRQPLHLRRPNMGFYGPLLSDQRNGNRNSD